MGNEIFYFTFYYLFKKIFTPLKATSKMSIGDTCYIAKQFSIFI